MRELIEEAYGSGAISCGGEVEEVDGEFGVDERGANFMGIAKFRGERLSSFISDEALGVKKRERERADGIGVV